MTTTPDAEARARRSVLRAAVGLALYAAAFGATFGAVSVASGLDLAQTMVLSLVMFSGASQFALVGVLGAGGAAGTAVAAALLLGVRNAFYGIPVSRLLRPRGRGRLVTAHLVIDETTAMAVAQPTERLGRYAFWATGVLLCLLWQLGTLGGAVAGDAVDPSVLDALGLDVAAPAVFLALLWPQVRQRSGVATALVGAAIALALVPVAPAGLPVVAAAAAALAFGLLRRPATGPAAGTTS